MESLELLQMTDVGIIVVPRDGKVGLVSGQDDALFDVVRGLCYLDRDVE